jgi:hypothetical protein
MPVLIETEFHDLPANCPQSLEGKLLFAVPKSESVIDKGEYWADAGTQRGDYSKQRSTCLRVQISSSDESLDSILHLLRTFPSHLSSYRQQIFPHSLAKVVLVWVSLDEIQ